MGGYLRAVWQCRYFWLAMVRMDLRSRYKRSALGMGWSLVHPLAVTTILCTVFHRIFHLDIRDYAPYLLAGLTSWHFLLNVTTQGCLCFFQGEPYMRQHALPIAIYPLRTALGASFHFAIALVLVIVMSWIFHGFGNIPALFTLIPSLFLFFILGWSLAIIAGICNVIYRDTEYVTQLGFQVLFYATPIMYTPEIATARGLDWLIHLNPVYWFLSLIREPILKGTVPAIETFGLAFAITALVFSAATGLIYRFQRRLIFYL